MFILSKAIIETPEGKMVDYAKLLPAMLAANADANKRIMVLEEAVMFVNLLPSPTKNDPVMEVLGA